MTDQQSPGSGQQASPEPLELHARPQPVTRINRKIVIGGAALLLVVIALIVLLALTPPGLRLSGPQELFNVEHKPITDALSKLPATYDGVKPNGWYIMLGALGAVSATGPAEFLVQGVGWRGLFAILAASTAAVALLILVVVPERKPAPARGSPPNISFFTIYRDARFWRVAPLAATGVGTSFSLQGLWAAPWLTDVAGLKRSAVVELLILMAAILSASALLLGALAERLRRAGVPTEMFLAGTLTLSMAAQLALLLGAPVSSRLLFAIIAAAGAAPVLSFAILARYFPREVAGRANAALGVLNMGAAFGLQSLAGLIIAQWAADGGRYPAVAHQTAMAAGLGLQLIYR